MRFRDRSVAGRELAKALEAYRGDGHAVVVALPRGGVPVAYEVARALGLSLELLVVRKLGVPWQRELGMGAVAEGGGLYLDRNMIRLVDLSDEELSAIVQREAAEVRRRVEMYRGGRAPPQLAGKRVILVDDGLATGGTAKAALDALRRGGVDEIALAVPVAAAETATALRPLVDELIAVTTPEHLGAIGAFYDDFSQLDDEEVLVWLDRAAQLQAGREEER